MKSRALVILLQWTMLFGSSSLAVRASDGDLRGLEARVERLTNTSLPDFASELFQSARAKVREARAIYNRQGTVPASLIREAQQKLDQFQRAATVTQQSMGQSYALRNASLQFNVARAFNAAAVHRTERIYQEALKLAREGRHAEARLRAGQAAREYQVLITQAKANTLRRFSEPLRSYQRSIASDLSALNANISDAGTLGRVDSVSERIKVNHGSRVVVDLNGDGILEPPYWEPPPPHPGPEPANSVTINERTTNSIKISWGDRSDNELGTRVLRSTNLSNWEVVSQLSPIPKFTVTSHTDQNLTPDTRYCYRIESFNNEGARSSQGNCTYTRDGNDIDVWRLQLRVKVADFSGAGTDSSPHVTVGDNGQGLPPYTYLDYGRDDFERGSDFTYDLNFAGISELSDITNLTITNYASGDNVLFIEEIALIVNHDQGSNSLENHVAFSRYFGATPSSALTLSGNYRVEHAELRSHPSWQSYVGRSKADKTFNLPKVTTSETNQFQLEIPAEEVVSRIESFVGHMLHADSEVGSRFGWGSLHGPAVEISRSNDSTVHVDLDMEAKVNNWPNPELDIDFDIAVAKRCDNTNNKLIINLTSKNFVSNADFATWKDIASLGFLKLTDLLIDWYAKNCTTPPEINQPFEVQLPPNISCNNLNIKVNPTASVSVCCFGLGGPSE